ncbi:MAG: hypothetical protein RR931_02900 [Mucinivorans sp.]
MNLEILIIRYLLQNESPLWLPQVGVLKCERVAASLEGSKLFAPHRQISFAAEDSTSLSFVELLEQQNGYSEEQANELYESFLIQALSEDGYCTIDGLGVLDLATAEIVSLDDQLSALLCPATDNPMELTPLMAYPTTSTRIEPKIKGAATLAIILSVIICIAAIGYILWWWLK